MEEVLNFYLSVYLLVARQTWYASFVVIFDFLVSSDANSGLTQ